MNSYRFWFEHNGALCSMTVQGSNPFDARDEWVEQYATAQDKEPTAFGRALLLSSNYEQIQ